MTRTSTAPRWLALFVAVSATSILACNKPRVVTQPEPSGLIVLLPDADDGKAGNVVVSNSAGSVELTSAYQMTRVGGARAPSAAAALDKADVDRMFAGVLSSLPPAPKHFTLNFELGSDELTPE